MEWTDEGIVLAVRRHGEAAAIASLLTRAHGRHLGLVRGGAGRRLRGVLQPGHRVRAWWRARLDEHLGSYTVELADARAAALLDDPDRLAALASALAVSEAAWPEREAHPRAFEALAALIDALSGEGFAASYARWELSLLKELGFGLDLETCAATGTRQNLTFVSPRSGRAVSADAGAAYRDKLLPLPAFLTGEAPADRRAVLEALRLTGHFLAEHAFAQRKDGSPTARDRLVTRLAKGVTPAPR